MDLPPAQLSYGWQANLPNPIAENAARRLSARGKICAVVCCKPSIEARLSTFWVGNPVASDSRMADSPQRIVYVLKNGDSPPRFYTGVTADLGARLNAHNAGRCSHTAKHRPWTVDLIVKFADEPRALRLEKYLKSGSGVEFAKRHLR